MSGPGAYCRETWAQTRRWLLHLKRQPFQIAFSLFQPLVFLLLFGGMFSRVLGSSLPGENYHSFILPGIVALTVFTNSMFGGVALLFDRESGFLERLLATPVARSSILVARFLFTNFISAVQTLLMVGVAWLLGARLATGLAGVAVLVGLGLLLGFGMTIISLVLAFRLKGHGDFFALLGAVTLPLVFLSNAFAPLEAMPGWLRVAARFNPLTYAIEGMRDAVVRGLDPGHLASMALALVAFDVLLFLWGARTLGKRLG